MSVSLKEIVKEFARRKAKFYKDEKWNEIKLFGLFSWGDVSPYLVGNPSRIKTFKKGLIKTTYKKENKIIWCNPTEEFWNNYILPYMKENNMEGI